MNSKIILGIIGVAVILAVFLLVSLSNTNKIEKNENSTVHINKENLSPSSVNYTLVANYTSSELLDYCTKDESRIYNDDCIRGLWNVSDECKNANFSSTLCNDSRLEDFENKVKKEMQNLDRSLLQFVDSCMNVTSENDIGNCSFNIDRIKNDCTESRYVSIMSVCNDPNMNGFAVKFANTLSKLKPEQ